MGKVYIVAIFLPRWFPGLNKGRSFMTRMASAFNAEYVEDLTLISSTAPFSLILNCVKILCLPFKFKLSAIFKLKFSWTIFVIRSDKYFSFQSEISVLVCP